jgi:hypothetical protein
LISNGIFFDLESARRQRLSASIGRFLKAVAAMQRLLTQAKNTVSARGAKLMCDEPGCQY